MFVVKSDDKGLYVQCGGWIGRPPTQGTKAIKGMKVRATHPAGGTIYVRFEPRGKPECWWIEGLSKEAVKVMRVSVSRVKELGVLNPIEEVARYLFNAYESHYWDNGVLKQTNWDDMSEATKDVHRHYAKKVIEILGGK